MPQKPKPSAKPDDPAEYKRFLATAKEVNADETAEGFERAVSVVIKPARSGASKGSR